MMKKIEDCQRNTTLTLRDEHSFPAWTARHMNSYFSAVLVGQFQTHHKSYLGKIYRNKTEICPMMRQFNPIYLIHLSVLNDLID